MVESRVVGFCAAFLLGSPAVASQASGPAANSPTSGVVWDARAVEHLYNRAAFGARPSEIEAGVALGQAALVERLVTQRLELEPFPCLRIEPPDQREIRGLSPEDREARFRQAREKDRIQLREYTSWWFDCMASGEDPLRERMVLFWHGFFTSSVEDEKRGWLLIRQNQLVREKALGSYADLLAAMVKDPAMLTYLDNQVNRKGRPNENFARELMELFSLGVGNYTESDVQEAARALTGRGVSPSGDYEFHPKQHDPGPKSILGVKGKLDGDDLVAIILKQDACPRWVARRLLGYFEGVEPGPERVADYAAFLRKNEYQLQPFLRRLFMDPAFYRDEVVGARVQGPVEYMVGLSRRLGARVPAVLLSNGAALLGQRLFSPPSVKGWDEGEAWITTASLMQRGNLAGFVLGVVQVDDVLSESDMEEAPSMRVPPVAEPSMDPGAMQSGDSMEGGSGPPDVRTGDGTVVGPAVGATAEPRNGDRESPEKPADRRKREGKKPKGGEGGAGNALIALRRAEASGWTVSINFTARMAKAGARTDAEIADRMLDELLAIRSPVDTRGRMRDFLARERARLRIEDGKLLDAGSEADRVLRRLAHLILSLPEAQLS